MMIFSWFFFSMTAKFLYKKSFFFRIEFSSKKKLPKKCRESLSLDSFQFFCETFPLGLSRGNGCIYLQRLMCRASVWKLAAIFRSNSTHNKSIQFHFFSFFSIFIRFSTFHLQQNVVYFLPNFVCYWVNPFPFFCFFFSLISLVSCLFVPQVCVVYLNQSVRLPLI